MISNFEKLEENIDKFINISSEGVFDILPYLLSTDEAVKKMLSKKNPKMSKEDIDTLVDSEEKQLEKLEKEFESDSGEESEESDESEDEGSSDIPDEETESEKERRKKQKEERRNQRNKEREERKKQREEDLEKIKEKRKERIKKLKQIFKDQLNGIYKEVKEIKEKLVFAVSQLFREFKDLVQELTLDLIQTATSIPAIVIIFSTPPWNVAQAISLVIIILLMYLKLISKIRNFWPILVPLKLLPLVTDRKNLKIVSSILNPIIEAVFALWIPIKALYKVIESLIKKLKELIKNPSVFRKATRRLKKLGHIRRRPDLPIPSIEGLGGDSPILRALKGRGGPIQLENGTTIYAYDEEDSDEIGALLEQFVLDGDGSNRSHKVVDYKVKFDDKIDELERELLDNEIPVDISDDDVDEFVYDVSLPDGTVIKGISEEAIEFFKEKYIVKFTNF